MISKNRFILIVAISVFLGFVGLKFFIEKKPSNESQTVKSISDSQAVNNNSQLVTGNNNNVLVQIGENIEAVSFADGSLNKIEGAQAGAFEDFTGLPQKDDDSSVSTNVKLFSSDKKKALVTAQVFDAKAPENADGTKLLKSSSDFICDLEKKACQATDILTQTYLGLNSDAQKKSNLWWSGWDAGRNILYANLTGESAGDVSPIWACDTQSKSCVKTDGYDSTIKGQIKAVVPQGNISPTLSKFVMINQNDIANEQTGNNWQLLLYQTSDLSKPSKQINISSAIDHGDDVSYDSVQSVAWNKEETKVFLGTTRKIFSLDLDSQKLDLLYTAPGNEDSGLFWDSGTLELSADGKFLLFTEFLDDPKQVEADSKMSDDNSSSEDNQTDLPEIGILKKIDLTNNTISEITRQSDLVLKIF